MKYAKDVTAVFIIILLGTVGFISLETTLQREEGHMNGYYGYILSSSASFVASDGHTEYAPIGQIYVIADILLKNTDWRGGISDDPSHFELEVDGGRRTIDPATYVHPAYHDPVTYKPWYQGQNCCLFIVPTGTDIIDVHIIYVGPTKVQYDPGLFTET